PVRFTDVLEAVDPGRRVVWYSTSPWSSRVEYVCTPDGPGTRVRADYDGDVSAWLRVLALLPTAVLARVLRRGFAGLRRALEAEDRTAARSSWDPGYRVGRDSRRLTRGRCGRRRRPRRWSRRGAPARGPRASPRSPRPCAPRRGRTRRARAQEPGVRSRAVRGRPRASRARARRARRPSFVAARPAPGAARRSCARRPRDAGRAARARSP